MKQSINSVTYLVREYDEAIEFFAAKLLKTNQHNFNFFESPGHRNCPHPVS